jgi:DNA-directed RNA polymerase specialized sigma24 family protein
VAVVTARPVLPVEPQRVYRYVGAVLWRLFPTSCREEREDVMQEVLLRLLTRSSACDNALAYAAAMARNMMIDERRTVSMRRRAEHALALMGRRTVGMGAADAALDLQRSLAWIERAPPLYREVIRRLVIEGDSIEDLIEELLASRGQEPADRAAWELARDTLYKRRLRAFQWMAQQEAQP